MHEELTPQDWLEGAGEDPELNGSITHPDPDFPALLAAARQRTELEHAVVKSLGDLRRAVGLTQIELGERWGRTQSFVSKIERDPASAEIETLVTYVRALGGRLTLTVEAGDHVFVEDLVAS